MNRQQLIVTCISLALGACSLAPPLETPDVDLPAAYKEALPAIEGQWQEAAPADAVERGEWWTIFGDPVLSALVVEAGTANQDLLAAAERVWLLALWFVLCLGGVQLLKMYTFGRGYAQGLSFLQRLKSWNLIDWAQRLKLANGVLVALFVLQAAPQHGPWVLAWGGGAGLLALGGAMRTRDRALFLAALVLVSLVAPWDRIVSSVSM
jgi:hypothetical protein